MSFDKPLCLLSVDVEDWFHLIGAGLDYQFRVSPGTPEVWDDLSPRVESNTRWILDTLDRFDTKATFFILGWVAKKHPEIVREIHRRGHEVASHSYWHKVIQSQTQEQFRADTRMSLEILQDITGEKVQGFRASSASITDWAVEILAEEGLVYDSSLFPVMYHDVYGKLTDTHPSQPIERLRNGLFEVKFSCLFLAGRGLPWSGGGYFRLLPYPIFRHGVQRILSRQKVFQFYIHPWEIDGAPPRLPNLKPFYSFRRYISIEHTRARFEQLLGDFQFISIAQGLRRFLQY
jgi:polysaccharide deacetylase family protein (PEP-CTERM system associated)